MNSGQPSSVRLVPYDEDPLHVLAQQLIENHQTQLPDLSQVIVLISEPRAAPRLRRLLLEQAQELGHQALLGPRIQTLRDWCLQYLPQGTTVCDEHSRELILVDALMKHPSLLGAASPWSLADNLLVLFDELTLNHIGLPQDLTQFVEQLTQAYGLGEQSFQALGQEAALVHTLWHAWHAQLQAEQLTDPQGAYLLALAASLKKLAPDTILYIAGLQHLYPAEVDWLSALLQKQQVQLFLHGQARASRPSENEYHPDAVLAKYYRDLALEPPPIVPSSPYAEAIDAALAASEPPLAERAAQFAQRHPQSPLKDRLAIFAGQDAEQEARGVDVQVRSWLLAGKQSIGIVTENRRLARRVRALLERADVYLQDAAGWALSTTSAAATVERLLECIEEDFAHLPFLDLLKSPFIFHDLDAKSAKHAVFRLEHDIIHKNQIARGLTNYKDHLMARRALLPHWLPDTYPLLLTMLENLNTATQTLQQLCTQGQHNAKDYLLALHTALEQLGMTTALTEDAAGVRLMQVLDQMSAAAQTAPLELTWLDFRTWLGRHLERCNFQPGTGNSQVQLMGLAQSSLHQFDALVIATAEQEYLPGNVNPAPFFNDAVRHELGLPTNTAHLAERLHHFRRLLEGAPEILITLRSEQDGEPITPSPWVEELQAFHQLAYGERLTARKLSSLVQQMETQVIRCDTEDLPVPQTRPTPSVTAHEMPKTLSASAYQQLMDCPYQFFTARCLQLAPPEEIRTALSKQDYGERVHQCLQAFHSKVPQWPGPFTKPFTTDNRADAIALLSEIAAAIFADDLQDNYEHHGWLKQWQAVIPAYIDWQIERVQNWQVDKTESNRKASLDANTHIKGRLDRIDHATSNQSDKAIIDYKTGAVPRSADVKNGESIQLPFYSLLAEYADNQNVQRVEYLKLDKAEKVSSACVLENDALTTLKDQIGERLVSLVSDIRAGQGLPAWGDEKTCGYCDMQRVCRRQAWENNVV